MCASLQHHRKHQLPFPPQTLISRPEVNDLTEANLSTMVQKAGQRSHRENQIRRKWGFAVVVLFFSFVPGYFGLRRDEKKVQDVPERQER